MEIKKENNKIYKLFTPIESKNLDMYSIQEWKMDPKILMGMAAASIFQQYRKYFQNKKLFFLCGNGNNGGDGLAIALLSQMEYLESYIFVRAGKHTPEFLYYLELCKKAGMKVYDFNQLTNLLNQSTHSNILLIDALIGIGFKPPLSEDLVEIINGINSFRKSNPNAEILSIDTPSGFGIEHNTCYIHADILAEISVHKTTNEFYRPYLKSYSYHPIGFPIEDFIRSSLNHEVFYKFVPFSIEELKYYSNRKKESHKYENGAASFIGGSDGMMGAIAISCDSFHRIGGGISKIFSPSQSALTTFLSINEAFMVAKLENEILSDPFFQKSSVCVIGPGLKPDEFPVNLENLLKANKYFIIDSGGLNTVKQISLNDKCILTPHSGEFTRLLDASHSSIGELIEQIRQYCLTCNVNVIYRSSFSIFCNPSGDVYIWNYPNPRLATMGTGDLFAGILAYYLSRKYTLLLSIHLTLSTINLSSMMKGSYPTAVEIKDYITEVLQSE